MDEKTNDPRTELAGKRTSLATFRTTQALDRTTLAWVRTTLTMGSFGFGMIGFFRTLQERSQSEAATRLHAAAVHFGELLVLAGLVATILAGVSHLRTLRLLERGVLPQASRWPLSVAVALFVVILGAAGLWHLFT